jgi:phosphoglycolate phosphatase
MTIASVLFDLDGTLVDSLPGIQFSSAAACGAVLPGRKLPDLRPFIGPPIREVFQRVFNDLSSSTLDGLVSHFRKSYDGEGCLKGTVYPGVRETLLGLKDLGIGCFVITNKPFEATLNILHHSRLAENFQAVYSPNRKNPPFRSKGEMTASLVQEFHLSPACTILVGDSLEDRMAAQECQMRFVAAAYGYGGIHLYLDGQAKDVLYSFPDLWRVVKDGKGPWISPSEGARQREGEKSESEHLSTRRNPKVKGRAS